MDRATNCFTELAFTGSGPARVAALATLLILGGVALVVLRRSDIGRRVLGPVAVAVAVVGSATAGFGAAAPSAGAEVMSPAPTASTIAPSRPACRPTSRSLAAQVAAENEMREAARQALIRSGGAGGATADPTFDSAFGGSAGSRATTTTTTTTVVASTTTTAPEPVSVIVHAVGTASATSDASGGGAQMSDQTGTIGLPLFDPACGQLVEVRSSVSYTFAERSFSLTNDSSDPVHVDSNFSASGEFTGGPGLAGELWATDNDSISIDLAPGESWSATYATGVHGGAPSDPPDYAFATTDPSQWQGFVVGSTSASAVEYGYAVSSSTPGETVEGPNEPYDGLVNHVMNGPSVNMVGHLYYRFIPRTGVDPATCTTMTVRPDFTP